MGMTHLGTYFDAEKCNHILARGRHGLLSGKWFQYEHNCWISSPPKHLFTRQKNSSISAAHLITSRSVRCCPLPLPMDDSQNIP